MKNNNNICSIFHKRFNRLVHLVGSQRKAHILDYILMGWQTSQYRLKDSNERWFMKPQKEFAEETRTPQSTIQRYLKQLEDEGFITRRQALYCRTTPEGDFEVKKGCYIHPTPKLLSLLEHTSAQKDVNNTSKTPALPTLNTPIPTSTCSNSNTNEGIEPLKMRESYISNLYTSVDNIIIQEKKKPSGDKHRAQSQFDAVQSFFQHEVKEEIPLPVQSLILATFCNLIFKDKLVFTHPKQLAAEYLWAFLNTEHFLPFAKEPSFRNNIFSKLLREGRWRTPKGFFNHAWLAQGFKKPQECEKDWQETKAREIADAVGVGALVNEVRESRASNPRLEEVEQRMASKSQEIDALYAGLYQQSDEESIALFQEKIQKARNELETLWQQQAEMEQELGWCA